MKITVWVLSTCIPEESKPCWPDVLPSQDEANAKFDALMRQEWKVNGGGRRYPGAWLAHERMSQIRDWGQYEITAHEIEVAI